MVGFYYGNRTTPLETGRLLPYCDSTVIFKHGGTLCFSLFTNRDGHMTFVGSYLHNDSLISSSFIKSFVKFSQYQSCIPFTTSGCNPLISLLTLRPQWVFEPFLFFIWVWWTFHPQPATLLILTWENCHMRHVMAF